MMCVMLVFVCILACRSQVVLRVRHCANVPRRPRPRKGTGREGLWSLMCMHAALCVCFLSACNAVTMAGVWHSVDARGTHTSRAVLQVSGWAGA